MSEATVNTAPAKRGKKLNYKGRMGQVIIYLGKLLRGFVYQSDWKVLPMAALIAGVVSMVVHRDFFVTMEGTLKGSLALTCTSIWNGCFNSIQSVCREREIIKREHRSGMHISSYILAHMIYQALLCLLQTAITLFVCSKAGIKFPEKGIFSRWLIVDLGVTIFLISYAADMLSLWISCVTRSTTTAMTVMPFVLIFQLVFSGGIFSLPSWANKMAFMSISNYGMKCLAAQSNYNDLEMVSGWNSLVKVQNKPISGTVTLGEVMDFLTTNDSKPIRDLRAKEILIPTREEELSMLLSMLGQDQIPDISQIVSMLSPAENKDGSAPQKTVTIGEALDELAKTEYIQSQRDESYSFNTTLRELMDIVGRDKLEKDIKEMTRSASRIDDYETSKINISSYWISLCCFIAVFAFLAVIFLEFVDKDKR